MILYIQSNGPTKVRKRQRESLIVLDNVRQKQTISQIEAIQPFMNPPDCRGFSFSLTVDRARQLHRELHKLGFVSCTVYVNAGDDFGEAAMNAINGPGK